MTSPTAYELRVAGHLDDHWSAWFDDLTLTRHADGTTVLTGPVADQAQLHGILARVRDLGVPLLSVRITESAAALEQATEETARAPRPSLMPLVRTRGTRPGQTSPTMPTPPGHD